MPPQQPSRSRPQLPTIKPHARIMGDERTEIRDRVARKYERGASIRALAAETGRSYGFIHRILGEAGVTIRNRGGGKGVRGPVRVQKAARRTAKAAQ